MKRRKFLKLGMASSATGFTAFPEVRSAIACESKMANHAMDMPWTKALYVPGYLLQDAYSQTESAIYHPELSRGVPVDYDGPIRMLTRFDRDGSVKQAVYPVFGHDVVISPDGKFGFYGSLEFETYVCFDPDTLDVVSLGAPVSDGWVGGGHGLFLGESSNLVVSERAPKVGYKGAPDKHFGCLTFRDPETMKPIERYSTHGVSPHDVRLLPDGQHLAVANYGSTFPAGMREYGLPRHIVEPSISIIEISSGKLVEKILSDSSTRELRHICVPDMEHIFAIQTEMRDPDEYQGFHSDDVLVYEHDYTSRSDFSYFPAPTLKFDRASTKFTNLGSDKQISAMRHGLSIQFDPIHDEVLATYPSSHTVFVFDKKTGEIKHHIDTKRLGLDYPCGLTMLPHPNFYAVTGYWKNLFIFERGTHKLVRDLCRYTTFFGHSHITVA